VVIMAMSGGSSTHCMIAGVIGVFAEHHKGDCMVGFRQYFGL